MTCNRDISCYNFPLFFNIVMEGEEIILREIKDLVAVLDPGKVRRNANRVLDILEDRGLISHDILMREMAEVLLQCVKAVSSGDMNMTPSERYIATNQRDGDSNLPAEIFGQRCLAMLREHEHVGLDNSRSVAAVQRDLYPLLVRTLGLRPLTVAESGVLYPAAYAAFVLRGPIFRQVHPNKQRRVLDVLNDIRVSANRLFFEASSASDKAEIGDMREFVMMWIRNRYLQQ